MFKWDSYERVAAQTSSQQQLKVQYTRGSLLMLPWATGLEMVENFGVVIERNVLSSGSSTSADVLCPSMSTSLPWTLTETGHFTADTLLQLIPKHNNQLFHKITAGSTLIAFNNTHIIKYCLDRRSFPERNYEVLNVSV